eukprot:TRINITY_DN21_c0_g1_i1.p1 TRINITY_DN21_c0_g1~~TRINITY_DN21_c0_g1_i1.p1  ORF type:complete len:257 (+),score=54.09 TRINITY_DN21_c0_g1_i1:91-861(+)
MACQRWFACGGTDHGAILVTDDSTDAGSTSESEDIVVVKRTTTSLTDPLGLCAAPEIGDDLDVHDLELTTGTEAELLARLESAVAARDMEAVILLAQTLLKRGKVEKLDSFKETTPAPIVGSWTCVETWGLDEFLTATGVGMIRRKLAAAAKWPSWDFVLDGNVVKLVNHSAMGDLKEDIDLTKEYDWKDGEGNPFRCRASWLPAKDGGTLRIERKGLGSIGDVTEERAVHGDRLEFKLTHAEKKVSWGRNFKRSS